MFIYRDYGSTASCDNNSKLEFSAGVLERSPPNQIGGGAAFGRLFCICKAGKWRFAYSNVNFFVAVVKCFNVDAVCDFVLLQMFVQK